MKLGEVIAIYLIAGAMFLFGKLIKKPDIQKRLVKKAKQWNYN